LSSQKHRTRLKSSLGIGQTFTNLFSSTKFAKYPPNYISVMDMGGGSSPNSPACKVSIGPKLAVQGVVRDYCCSRLICFSFLFRSPCFGTGIRLMHASSVVTGTYDLKVSEHPIITMSPSLFAKRVETASSCICFHRHLYLHFGSPCGGRSPVWEGI
jgi:hypothetical protein